MLYHRNVYWKNHFDEQSNDLLKGNLRFTKHLEEHLENNNDRSHSLDYDLLCDSIENIKSAYIEPFEVETNEFDNVVKTVIRTRYNKTQDVCVVFRKNLVITAYLNKRNDKHISLDIGKYERGSL